MFINSIHLEFRDYDPEFNFQDFLSRTAERIQCAAPSDSNVNVEINRNGESIKVNCKIISFAGTFIGEAVNKSAYLATEEAESNIVRQLNVWKAFRFSELGGESAT